MNTNLNLLFCVLALQSGLINSGQFAEACSLWATRKDTPIVDLLLERGWLVEADVAPLLYLVHRNLEKHEGDPKLTLAAIGNEEIKRQLASIKDAEIQQSLGYTPDSDASTVRLGVLSDKPERYSLIHLHATGGGGRVWLAHDAQLDRNVAYKELRPELAEDVALWARFHKEARITGQLEHPGIVPVYDYGRRANNQSFYTMRFVRGRTLAEAARDYHKRRVSGEANPLELISLLNALTTVCNTIAYAHSRGVIHRDLKGQNVVLGDFGEVVVLDWGLAKLVNEPEQDENAEYLRDPRTLHFNLTMPGETIGTPGYMAPEQAAGRSDQIGRRTDVYGLGAILYQILTGNPPFSGSDTEEVIRRVREEEPEAPSRLCPDVPEELDTICLKAMSKKTADRYERAADLAQDVQLWQERQRKKAEQELDRFFKLSLDLFCVAGFDGYF